MRDGNAPDKAMSPTTRATKKASSKGKTKSLSEPNLEKHLNAIAERHLQGEEALFQSSATDTGNITDVQESINDADEDSSVLELATPKASAKRASSKAKAIPAHQPVQAASKAPSRKRTVDQTLFSPTPISNKARRPQPSEYESTSQHSQQLSALMTLIGTQNQEISGLKDMVEAQSKEISDIKKLLKKLSANTSAGPAISATTESMASHLGSLHASKATSPSPDNIGHAQNTPKPMRNGPHIALDLSQCKSENLQLSFSQIRAFFQTSIESNPGTKNIKIVGMNKDARREHHYYVIFQTKEEETLARVHDQWVRLHFPQARMQLPTSYPIKVNRA